MIPFDLICRNCGARFVPWKVIVQIRFVRYSPAHKWHLIDWSGEASYGARTRCGRRWGKATRF